MSECCTEPDCRRHYPVSIYLTDFSDTVYAVLGRRVVSESDDGKTATFAATQRHDITAQIREFIRRNPEWVRARLDEMAAVQAGEDQQ